MTNFNNLSRKEQESYLMFPIIRELKSLGGQSTTGKLRKYELYVTPVTTYELGDFFTDED